MPADFCLGGWLIQPALNRAADRALELDPDNAVARVALGRIRLHVDWDWDGAGRELRSAVAVDPRHFRLALSHDVLCDIGRPLFRALAHVRAVLILVADVRYALA